MNKSPIKQYGKCNLNLTGNIAYLSERFGYVGNIGTEKIVPAILVELIKRIEYLEAQLQDRQSQ